MRQGFTLLETMLAVAILGILFVVGLQADSIFEGVMVARGARQVESVLNLAAMRARSGMNGTNWGVYFDYDETTRKATRAVLYSGTTYASRDATQDVVYPLGEQLKLTNVSLRGAGVSTGNDHEIDFTFLSGATTQYGVVTITSFDSTTQIDVSSVGIAVRH